MYRLLLAALLAPLCSMASRRIVDGEAADIRDFAYLASLQYNGSFFGHDVDHFCCGAILNERWLVTSAQCALARDDFQVRVGSASYFEGGSVHRIERAVAHPRFSRLSRDYDFALLRLASPLRFGERVQPVPLAEGQPDGRDELAIAGWGAARPLGRPSELLRRGRVRPLGEEACRRVYGAALSGRMFCAFAEGSGPCVGDTGSPALRAGRLVGLASWSAGCELAAVYAGLWSVRGWLEETVVD